MSLIVLTYVFSVGNTIIASQHNTNNSVIYNDYNGNITTANLAANAGIAYTQLSLVGTIRQTDLISTFNNNSGFGMVPSGGIIMWSGTIATIPTGWFLCNGSNSTPDLRNRFIVCADADVVGVAESTITGSALQTSEGQLPLTTVTISQFKTGNSGTSFGTGIPTDGVSSSNLSGTFGTGTANVARFYALAYIMKS